MPETDPVAPKIDPGSVAVAYVHPNQVSYSWHRSLMEMVGWDLAHECRVMRGGWLSIHFGADGLVAARNKAVGEFLDSDAEWLWWIDTDMGFAPDTVDRLIQAADPETRPIVGGLCFAQRELMSDDMGGHRCVAAPTVFDWVEAGGVKGFGTRSQYPVNTLVRCAGTGSACVLVHRSVFERIFVARGPVWYDRVQSPNGQLISEDLSFCLRAGALDIPVHVHTGIRTTHHKEFWLSEEDYWTRAVAPPARDRVAVIVPVLGRPQNAAPFMESLDASTGLATVYAVVSPDDPDTEDAWRAAGAEVILGDEEWVGIAPAQIVARTFAEKVNLGYRQTTEPWLFLVGDDVRFHAGWLDHAQVMGEDKYHVIGTNDLGNPRVTSGEHATHLLVRRSYIDDMGSSWDGPKVVAHEGYGHWFVDDELVTAAKQRGVWAMALGSLVEHLHPAWGKAKDDYVYRLGESHATADRETFEARCKINL